MDIYCIKFVHVGTAYYVASHKQIISSSVSSQFLLMYIFEIDGVTGSQSAFKICVILGCPFEVHQPPDNLVRYYRRSPIVSNVVGGEPV